MFHSGDRIGPYTLVRVIGKGAFGEVWLAEKRGQFATTKFALKLPLQENIDTNAIEQEASVWVQASGHPNILPIIEADAYDGQIVIVSEYAPDGSLLDWLKTHGGKSPSLTAAAKMMDGILAGLEHLHARRIIHRDLKPANILLQGDTPRLADFGISRILKTTQSTMSFGGTPPYMAPEAWRGKRSVQTDLWAAGVILYHLLTGSFPFAGADLYALFDAIKSDEPAPLPNSIPEPMRRVVANALKKDPGERFLNISAMRQALQGAMQLTSNTLPYPAFPSSMNPTSTEPPLLTLYTETINSVNLEMVLIPSGKFMMGSPVGEGLKNERPQHEVMISQPFYMGKYQVTQTQWRKVAALPKIKIDLQANPSYFKGDNLPVEQVSWEEAVEFCERLSKVTGNTWRLPSEAEWEYACRAGTTGDYARSLDEMAWYIKNSDSKTHPVGQKRANAFGLNDMHGNVWEWCEDIFHDNYTGAPADGSAWLTPRSDGKDYRLLRGGSWYYHAQVCRSACRYWDKADRRNNYFGGFGFRVIAVVRTV